MPKVAVRVTEAHIRAGVRRHPLLCPLALAIKEQTGEQRAIYLPSGASERAGYRFAQCVKFQGDVRPEDLREDDDYYPTEPWEWWHEVDAEASDHVHQFDQDGTCAPFTATIHTGSWDDHHRANCECDCDDCRFDPANTTREPPECDCVSDIDCDCYAADYRRNPDYCICSLAGDFDPEFAR